MMTFLKRFFAGERTADERALVAAGAQRDYLTLDTAGMDDAADEGDDCADAPSGGCCGRCGCS